MTFARAHFALLSVTGSISRQKTSFVKPGNLWNETFRTMLDKRGLISCGLGFPLANDISVHVAIESASIGSANGKEVMSVYCQ